MLAVCTELFLSSDGFQFRKQTFGCLVDYLEEHNVTDENFSVAESYDILTDNCSEIVEQTNQSFYGDLKQRMLCFYYAYNVTAEHCEKLKSPLCNETATTDKNNKTLATCYDLVLSKNSSPYEDKLEIYNQLNNLCSLATNCLNYVLGNLAATEYELVRFHATAVNVTVIEFQVWKYYAISPRVKDLVSLGKALEASALDDCKKSKTCDDDVKYCE